MLVAMPLFERGCTPTQVLKTPATHMIATMSVESLSLPCLIHHGQRNSRWGCAWELLELYPNGAGRRNNGQYHDVSLIETSRPVMDSAVDCCAILPELRLCARISGTFPSNALTKRQFSLLRDIADTDQHFRSRRAITGH